MCGHHKNASSDPVMHPAHTRRLRITILLIQTTIKRKEYTLTHFDDRKVQIHTKTFYEVNISTLVGYIRVLNLLAILRRTAC